MFFFYNRHWAAQLKRMTKSAWGQRSLQIVWYLVECQRKAKRDSQVEFIVFKVNSARNMGILENNISF